MHIDHPVVLLDQQTNALRLYDADRDLSPGSECWIFRAPWKEIFQDARLRLHNGRPLVLAACSLFCAAIADAGTGEVIWLTRQASDNPHAMELLPDGTVVVACSDGGALSFFDLHGADPAAPLGELALFQPHGLWYDPARDRLWVLDYTHLRLLRLTRTESGITAEEEAAVPFPEGDGGHDLWAVAGSSGQRLWVTNHQRVWQFDTQTLQYLSDYPGAAQIDRPHTKGIGSFADGCVAALVPDAGFHPWTAASARLFRPGEAGDFRSQELAFPGRASYKIRAWLAEYIP